MKLNRKLWTAALAVAMTTPSAMAAQDTAGMHYTSAAEGFYASIRVRYVSNGGKKDGGADIQNSSTRFGVRGTNDLGGGLEGFYQYEAGITTDQGGGLGTRIGHVGLRGDFGSVVAGAFWPDSYNWVYGSTDVANRHSGNIAFGDTAADVGPGFGQYRTNKSLQYTTPDLNGFQGALLVKADSGSEDFDGDGKDDNDVDHWNLAAKYEIAGFSMGAMYANSPDAIAGVASKANSHFDLAGAKTTIVSDLLETANTNTVFGAALDSLAGAVTLSRQQYLDQAITVHPFEKKDDMTAWAVKLGYSQDNWYVNGWYGEVNHGDAGKGEVRAEVGGLSASETVSLQDSEVFSVAGGITVDKVAVYAVHENIEDQYARDNAYTTLGVQYTLGSNSWTWVEYAGRDLDSSETEDDDFSIGLGHSF